MEHKSNMSINDHSKLIVCYFSHPLFNGYRVCIETEKLNLTSDIKALTKSIVDYCYNDLYNHLKTFNFDNLANELSSKRGQFHLHQNVILPLIMTQPIYVCLH